MSLRSQQTLERAPRPRAAAKIPSVRVVFEPDGTGLDSRLIRLPEGRTEIGRDPESESSIVLSDRYASRVHCHLDVCGTEVTLTDSSTHGSFVSGKQIERSKLADGDVVRVGDSLLVFRLLPPESVDASIPALLGDAPSMGKLRHTISLVAPSEASVLLLGSSGTGKDIVARSIHELSGVPGPLVAVNCAAISESLAESQLFGHVKGSFTGASSDSKGYFGEAEGGTLFLDEIGELSAPLQAKLLRAVENREVVPVGATKPRSVNLRLVTATLSDLQGRVESGDFRKDLYARIAEITITTPRLREHREDILLLFQHALGPCNLAAELAEALLGYHWPLNVRELFKVAKELEVLGRDSDELTLDLVEERLARNPAAETGAPEVLPQRAHPETVDRALLEQLLTEHDGKVARVATATGRSRRQIYRYVEKFGIDLNHYRRPN